MPLPVPTLRRPPSLTGALPPPLWPKGAAAGGGSLLLLSRRARRAEASGVSSFFPLGPPPLREAACGLHDPPPPLLLFSNSHRNAAPGSAVQLRPLPARKGPRDVFSIGWFCCPLDFMLYKLEFALETGVSVPLQLERPTHRGYSSPPPFLKL
ncbi:Hypothetical predicted protein [Podarcis lilfordi]|uniref:Uncharacterized protein n=1 Tax=Podarcis lilfordi TaxID=74358 RepID=A0AA35KI73_9SAUR|nr:Hypothetical predicted protein [Podarcis lilfordi]